MSHPVDRAVGKRLRIIRKLRKFSQGTLGKAIGITFQQIQKYENASNRISASRLWLLAEQLKIPIEYFFADLDKEEGDNPADLSPEAFEVAVLYDNLSNEIVQKKMLELFRVMVNPVEDSHDES